MTIYYLLNKPLEITYLHLYDNMVNIYTWFKVNQDI